MSVSKKDFEAIASILKDVSLYSGYSQPVKMTAKRLCDYFETQNALFDRERFLSACGVLENDNN